MQASSHSNTITHTSLHKGSPSAAGRGTINHTDMQARVEARLQCRPCSPLYASSVGHFRIREGGHESLTSPSSRVCFSFVNHGGMSSEAPSPCQVSIHGWRTAYAHAYACPGRPAQRPQKKRSCPMMVMEASQKACSAHTCQESSSRRTRTRTECCNGRCPAHSYQQQGIRSSSNSSNRSSPSESMADIVEKTRRPSVLCSASKCMAGTASS
jgi:hypothetical protein